jgi:hypothetical protein
MTNKYISEINIIYDIYKKNIKIEKENTINIFGGEFVKNNKNICKMIIDDEEYEIIEKYNLKKFNKNKLKIKLKGIDNIISLNILIFQNGILIILLICVKFFIIVHNYFLYLYFKIEYQKYY